MGRFDGVTSPGFARKIEQDQNRIPPGVALSDSGLILRPASDTSVWNIVT
jgi:hypothetical protein